LQQTHHFSLVLETPTADPAEANAHFLAKLSVETDVADLMSDLKRGVHDGFVLLDVRDKTAFGDCHIPTAINLPTSRISADTTRDMSTDQVVVVYCWGPARNGATKAAVRLTGLGFRVKELIGGIEYWRKEGGQIEGTLSDQAPLYWQMKS